ncbi:MAG: hypothetical protein JO069_08940 [Verrucomicrobia bacterium]|nr:hypothetical protein [Verrucomicrobiota bacterium]
MPATVERTKGKYVSSPGEELGRIRTLPVPGLDRNQGSAEYFLLFSGEKVAATKFIAGDGDSKEADAALRALSYGTWPDDGPEKIVRRGILACSQYTKPKCQMVLLPVATTHK